MRVGVVHPLAEEAPVQRREAAMVLRHLPRECPYPHAAGTTNPIGLEDFGDENNTAGEEEMRKYADAPPPRRHRSLREDPLEESPMWTMEEELVVQRALQSRSAWALADGYPSCLRGLALAGVIASTAMGLIKGSGASSLGGKVPGGAGEKSHFV